jgi:hypothetical protein
MSISRAKGLITNTWVWKWHNADYMLWIFLGCDTVSFDECLPALQNISYSCPEVGDSISNRNAHIYVTSQRTRYFDVNESIVYHIYTFLCMWCNGPPRVKASSFLRSLGFTQAVRHTPGRTPLNEWSARLTGRYIHRTQLTQETEHPCP